MTHTPQTNDRPRLRPQDDLIADERQRRDFYDSYLNVVRSGNDTLFNELLSPTSANGNTLGRPSELTARALLVAGNMLALADLAVTVKGMRRILNDLSDDQADLVGLPERKSKGLRVSLRQVSHLFNRIAELVDDYPEHVGRRVRINPPADGVAVYIRMTDPKCLDPELSDDDAAIHRQRATSRRGELRVDKATPGAEPTPLSTDDLRARGKRLDLVTDNALGATIPTEEAFAYQAVAIDGTDFETYGNSYINGVHTSADPTAAWGYRTSAPSNSLTPRRQHKAPANLPAPPTDEPAKGDLYYGHVFTFGSLVSAIDYQAVTNHKGEPVRLPDLNAVMRSEAANSAPTAELVGGMLRPLTALNIGIDEVLYDIGFSNKAGMARVVAYAGYFQTHALKVERKKKKNKKENDFRGDVGGAGLVGGIPVCPEMPVDVLKPEVPGPQANRDEWRRYHEAYDKFSVWTFERLGKPTPDGVQRYLDPAYYGKLICPRRDPKVQISSKKLKSDRPEVYDPEPHPCCEKATLRVEPDLPADKVGQHQRYPHGSRAYTASYDRRTGVERHNKAVKDRGVGRLDVRVLGRARRTLMVMFGEVATNIKLLRNYEDYTGITASPLTPRPDWENSYQ